MLKKSADEGDEDAKKYLADLEGECIRFVHLYLADL